MFFFISLVPFVVSVTTFIVYAAVGNDLNPAVIFEAVALFNLVRMPLFTLPLSLVGLSQGQGAPILFPL